MEVTADRCRRRTASAVSPGGEPSAPGGPFAAGDVARGRRRQGLAWSATPPARGRCSARTSAESGTVVRRRSFAGPRGARGGVGWVSGRGPGTDRLDVLVREGRRDTEREHLDDRTDHLAGAGRLADERADRAGREADRPDPR